MGVLGWLSSNSLFAVLRVCMKPRREYEILQTEILRKPGENARFCTVRVGRKPGENARFCTLRVGRQPGENARFCTLRVGRKPGENARFCILRVGRKPGENARMRDSAHLYWRKLGSNARFVTLDRPGKVEIVITHLSDTVRSLVGFCFGSVIGFTVASV